jgi:hypothetical protein
MQNILLPDKCYTVNNTDGSIIIVKNGEKGYWPAPGMTLEAADEKNASMGVSYAEREAMTYASVFGWNLPIADPSKHRKAKALAEK